MKKVELLMQLVCIVLAKSLFGKFKSDRRELLGAYNMCCLPTKELENADTAHFQSRKKPI